MTMKQLGEMTGVTESAIGMYETGKRQPSYEMLLKLSEALKCSVDDIMRTKEEKPATERDELVETVQLLKDRPELKALLDVSSRNTPEQVKRLIDMMLLWEER